MRIYGKLFILFTFVSKNIAKGDSLNSYCHWGAVTQAMNIGEQATPQRCGSSDGVLRQ